MSSMTYTQKADQLQTAFKQVEKFFPPDFAKRWNNDVEVYKEFANNPVFQVAVVGTINAGKSTLLNAILGSEVASTEVTPETASLTIFKYSPEYYVKVKFLTRLEWNKLQDALTKKPNSVFSQEFKALNGEQFVSKWVEHSEIRENTTVAALKDTVKRYSSSRSAEHYFVKELEIGLAQFPDFLPREIVLVDTPGLDDVVPYRSDITKEYIRRANAIIVCINSDFLANEQYLTLTKVFEQVGERSKVIVLGTKVDKFTNPQQDWNKQKLEWKKYLADLFQDPALMDKNLIGVSSRIFSLLTKSKDQTLEDKDTTEIVSFANANGIEISSVVSNDDLEEAMKAGGGIDMGKLLAKAQRKIIADKRDDIASKSNLPEFFGVLENGPLKDSKVKLDGELARQYQSIENEVKAQVSDRLKSVEEQVKSLNGTIQEKEVAIKRKQDEFKAMNEYAVKVEKSFVEMREKVQSSIGDIKSELDAALLRSARGGR